MNLIFYLALFLLMTIISFTYSNYFLFSTLFSSPIFDKQRIFNLTVYFTLTVPLFYHLFLLSLFNILTLAILFPITKYQIYVLISCLVHIVYFIKYSNQDSP